ncbi:MAG: flippase [Actinomycetota bacterium]
MDKDLTSSLEKVAWGTLVVFLGLCANALFRFLTRMILARGLQESEYGVFILGVVVLEFTVMLGGMGMGVGSARFVSYFRARGDAAGVKGAVLASFRICLVSGVAFSAGLWGLSDALSGWFKEPTLAPVLRVLSLAVPLAILKDLFIGVFRGFERVQVKVFFQDFLLYGSSALAALVALRLGLGTAGVARAYLVAYALSGALLFAYTSRILPPLLGPGKASLMAVKLLAFSLPLALESLLNMAVLWTDTLMLGLMRSSREVGVYNAAVPFANLLPIFLLSANYIFLPVLTRTLAAGRREDAGALYRSVTKWTFTLTMPLFLFFIFFPREIIVFFAGGKYTGAGIVLALLSLGYLGHVFLGPNGLTLVALGRTRLVLLDGVITAGSNVLLNYFFISAWGMKGAALASALALLLGNVIRSLQVYLIAGIHPFSGRYLKPVVLVSQAWVIAYPPVAWALRGRGWMAPVLYPVFLTSALVMVLVSRSLEREDLLMLSGVMSALRVPPERAVRFLERFVVSRQWGRRERFGYPGRRPERGRPE